MLGYIKQFRIVGILAASIAIFSCSESDDTINPPEEELIFQNPQSVQIAGYVGDAMEPFISPDGQYLFFNDINDAVDTKLHYSTRVNDSTFMYVDVLDGTSQSSQPRLDAVADMDINNFFIWTSSRGYPANFDNLHYGIFNNGNVTDVGRLRGDFYIYSPGWILMDHGLSTDGQLLYFNNARFDGSNCAGPCETWIGIAEKVNDSTFMKISNSDEIMKNINDQNYKYYAPCITEDGLEFYYTRFLQGDLDSNSIAEICLSTRDSPSATFSAPTVLFSDKIFTSIIEAPTLTRDKQIMYYHKKVNGAFKIMMRRR